MYQITERTINVQSLLDAVQSPAAGAVVLFIGSTRNENEGRAVERLEYEAYRDMAIAEIERIGAEIERRWGGVSVAIAHRVGDVPIGEASVVVAVSAAHRDEAFEACRHGIDTLKETVPIWKKEFYRDGSCWIGSCRHEHGSGAARDEGVTGAE